MALLVAIYSQHYDYSGEKELYKNIPVLFVRSIHMANGKPGEEVGLGPGAAGEEAEGRGDCPCLPMVGQKGNAKILLNRIPHYAAGPIDGDIDT